MANRKKGPTPEQWAEWAEVRHRMEESLRRHQARTAELREREERRRHRLQRLSFGLLGR
jgi:hypothetical protein